MRDGDIRYSNFKNLRLVELEYATETAKICGCDSKTVRKILKERNIKIISSQEISKKSSSKMINQYDLKDNYIKTFPSVRDAARYIQNLFQKTTNLGGISGHISEAARGKRKTAYKFKWKFVD